MTPRYSAILISSAVILLGGCAVQQPAPDIDIFHGGLEKVEAGRFDLAYLLPGADFSGYKSVLVDTPDLAFVTPDRTQQQFPLSEAQKAQFRDVLSAKFRAEIEASPTLTLAEAPGPDVLKLKIRVQDIAANLQKAGVGNAGRAAIALKAQGRGTLVLELRDAQSEETLAKAADSLSTQGVAILQDEGALTSWSQVEKTCEVWAKAARRGVEALITR
jgi:hypothetical protein